MMEQTCNHKTDGRQLVSIIRKCENAHNTTAHTHMYSINSFSWLSTM